MQNRRKFMLKHYFLSMLYQRDQQNLIIVMAGVRVIDGDDETSLLKLCVFSKKKNSYIIDGSKNVTCCRFKIKTT